jgi:hypothetical protein
VLVMEFAQVRTVFKYGLQVGVLKRLRCAGRGVEDFLVSIL